MCVLHTMDELRRCLRRGYATRTELDDYIARRLASVVHHAALRSPFYRDRWKELRPPEIRGPADLARIPAVSRDELLDADEADLLSDDMRRGDLVPHTSSGTSGERIFTMTHTREELQLLRLYILRAFREQGWRASDHMVRIWQAHTRKQSDPQRKRLMDAVGLFRRSEIDWPQDPGTAAARLRELRPTIVRGLPGGITRATARLSDEDIAALRVRRIFLDGEWLSPSMRAYLESRWRCPVTQVYGSTEVMAMAWECPDCGLLHLCEDSVHVEVLRGDGVPAAPGESGEVVATSLHGYALPLIRYRLGDLVVRGPDKAPCGRPFRSLERILGRKSDRREFAGAVHIHPSDLAPLLARSLWIRHFQLAVRGPDAITLRVVPAVKTPSENDLDKARRELSEIFGQPVKTSIEVVDDIPVEPGGKQRLVVAASA